MKVDETHLTKISIIVLSVGLLLLALSVKLLEAKPITFQEFYATPENTRVVLSGEITQIEERGNLTLATLSTKCDIPLISWEPVEKMEEASIGKEVTIIGTKTQYKEEFQVALEKITLGTE